MKKIKILCFLDSQKGRDVEILIPLIYFAEKYLNCIIKVKLLWDLHAIYREKPDLVLLANAVGSKLHFLASKYAYENDINVFALISEGNFKTNGNFNYWGYNSDKLFYQDFVCFWSKRTLDWLKDKEPLIKDKMVLTGGLGFDRYKIYKFAKKEDFLKQHGLQHFEKVIGYAGWAFGKLYNKQGRLELHLDENPGKEEWIENQMYLVEDILKKAIENNPDILFILKRHPNEANPSITKHGMNEMVRLKDFPNVLYLHGNENIHDLISISDLWTGFETTTCLEAWTMSKNETVLINPDPDFYRDALYKGSLIAKNYDEFQLLINEYYKNGKIDACHGENIKHVRNELIYDTIGFEDGLNHLRAGFYLKRTIENIHKNTEKKQNIKFKFNYFVRYFLMNIGKYLYVKNVFLRLPRFKKTIWIFENYKFNEFNELKNKYYTYLENFYNEQRLNEKIKENSFWEQIIEEK